MTTKYFEFAKVPENETRIVGNIRLEYIIPFKSRMSSLEMKFITGDV